MKEIESEGKTVTDAVDAALKRLGLRREQVEVQILQEGSSGILGFGAKPARLKIMEKRWGGAPAEKPQPAGARGRRDGAPAPRRSGDYPPAELPARENRGDSGRRSEPKRESRPERRSEARRGEQFRPERRQEPKREPRPQRAPVSVPLTSAQTDAACRKAQDLLKEVLSLMLFEDARVSVRWDQAQERVKAAIETSDHKRLIGHEGRTLESLQFLVTLMVGRRLGNPVAVQVDTQGYWENRENAILSEARKGAETVRSTGKPFRLAPMDPQMRRLIHRSLAGDPDIVTSSEGDGAWRKIVLRPSK